jgi:hypothetical protein
MVPVPLNVNWAPLELVLTILTVNVPVPEAPLNIPLPPVMVAGKVAVSVVKFGMVAVAVKLSNLLNERVTVD